MSNQNNSDDKTTFSITDVQSISDFVLDSGFSKEFTPKEHPMGCCCCLSCCAVAVIPEDK